MAGAVVIQTEELRRIAGWFEDRHRSLSALTPTIAQMLVTGVNDVFEAQGPGWQRLSESTIEKRREDGRGARIMQDTGVLAASIVGASSQDDAEAMTNVPYIIYHLDGGPIIPKRNPFEIDEGVVLDQTVELLLNAMTVGS